MLLIPVLLKKRTFTTRHLTWTWSGKLLRNVSCKTFDMNEVFSIKKVWCQKWGQVSTFVLLKYWILDINHWTGNPITWLIIRCIFFNLEKKRPSETWKSTGKHCQLKQLKEDVEFLIPYTWLEKWLTGLDSPGSGCAGQSFICVLRSNASVSFMRHN